MKKIIRISENRLKEIVNESVTKVLSLYEETEGKIQDSELNEFLSKLSEEELRKLWVYYSSIEHAASYSNPLTILMANSLHEGLIHTYPIDKTISYIQSYFGLNSQQIKPIKAENGITHIHVIIPTIGNNFELIERAMGLCGYYLGFPQRDSIPSNSLVRLQFEPKIQKDDSEQIRDSETTLLHLTPIYNKKKIQSIGFSPRCKNELFNYPSRVYFLRGSLSPNGVMDIGQQLFRANNSLGNNGEYALFTIDLNKIPKDVELFLDPNYPHGIYTTSNIKPDTIINVSSIKFK